MCLRLLAESFLFAELVTKDYLFTRGLSKSRDHKLISLPSAGIEVIEIALQAYRRSKLSVECLACPAR
jgi:hypothetical protein